MVETEDSVGKEEGVVSDRVARGRDGEGVEGIRELSQGVNLLQPRKIGALKGECLVVKQDIQLYGTKF